ncbi:DUF2513 domain-containing protein [Comamonas sp. Y6]|uniref:DUF2513 domain-containing protein n=1 Tax=Comamonas resistens TaxID=3046670 RepID=A0ABY8SXG5_9BURK|nr:DUF2513 domain-containing protein [Comamonas resistens]MDL5039398.1 DUF2513 domain-containing protein [Comamonas resistens]WHS67440.1 DUF2513 domain-containing protein [Comamonas resistens]
MKRDLDLVRKILMYFEEKEDDKMERDIELEGYESSLISYHLLIMDEAGLLRCERSYSKATPDRVIKVYPFSLTWKGHEFLSTAKNDGLWSKAKTISMKQAGILSFELLKELLISLAKDQAGITNG